MSGGRARVARAGTADVLACRPQFSAAGYGAPQQQGPAGAARRGSPAPRAGAVSRILLAWELGGGLGHIRRMAPVARALRQAGHEVWVAVRQLGRAGADLGDEDIHLLQVPVPLTPVIRATAVIHADILRWGGWADPVVLGAMVEAWRQMVALVDPGLMLLDHAPTGLLAARSLGLPRATLGTGFQTPPHAHPLPPLQPWLPADAEARAGAEAPILDSVNTVLARVGASPIEVLADVFAADEHFLCTVPELDHFPGRGAVRYWGPVSITGGGPEPDWPDGDPDRRVFLYASASHPRFADLASAAHREAGLAVRARTFQNQSVAAMEVRKVYVLSGPHFGATVRT